MAELQFLALNVDIDLISLSVTWWKHDNQWDALVPAYKVCENDGICFNSSQDPINALGVPLKCGTYSSGIFHTGKFILFSGSKELACSFKPDTIYIPIFILCQCGYFHYLQNCKSFLKPTKVLYPGIL